MQRLGSQDCWRLCSHIFWGLNPRDYTLGGVQRSLYCTVKSQWDHCDSATSCPGRSPAQPPESPVHLLMFSWRAPHLRSGCALLPWGAGAASICFSCPFAATVEGTSESTWDIARCMAWRLWRCDQSHTWIHLRQIWLWMSRTMVWCGSRILGIPEGMRLWRVPQAVLLGPFHPSRVPGLWGQKQAQRFWRGFEPFPIALIIRTF